MKRKLVTLIAAIVLLIVGAIAVISLTFDSAVMLIKKGDYETAKPKLEWLAMIEYTHAQLLLGEMYAYGWGVTRDRDEAIKWFRRATYRAKELKDPAAYMAYYVGWNFSGSSAANQDLVEAAWWIQVAIDGGYSGSLQGETVEQ